MHSGRRYSTGGVVRRNPRREERAGDEGVLSNAKAARDERGPEADDRGGGQDGTARGEVSAEHRITQAEGQVIELLIILKSFSGVLSVIHK